VLQLLVLATAKQFDLLIVV